MLTYGEFRRLLNIHRYRDIDKETEYNLYNFFVNRGMDLEQASAFLNGAKKRAIISSENEKFVRLNLLELISEYSSQADIELYKRIDQIDRKFKEYYISHGIKSVKTDAIIKAVNKAIKNRNDAFTHDLAEFTEAELSKMWSVACIYNAINNSLNKDGEERSADEIVGKGFARSIEKNQTLKIDGEMVADIEGLLESLTTASGSLPEAEIFAPSEVKRLLKRTTSLLYTTDKIKATKVRETLSAYLTELETLAVDRSEEKEFLTKTTAKSIVLKAGTILARTPEAVGEGLDLLMGKTVSEVMQDKTADVGKRDKTKKEFCERFPNLTIQGFSLDKHLFMLQHKTSLIAGLNVLSLSKVTNQLIDGLSDGLLEDAQDLSIGQKIQKLNQLGINTEGLIHADNIFDLIITDPLTRPEKKNCFAGNIKTLSQILSAKDMQKIVKHNMGLLCQDPEWVEEQITAILVENQKNPNGFKEKMELFVNTPFKLLDIQSRSSQPSQPSEKYGDEEQMDIDENKDYIELDLFKFNFHNEAEVEKKIRTEEITKDNYLDLLYFELSELNSYLDSKIFRIEPSLQPGSIGFLLNHINSGSYVPEVRGSVVNKLKKIQIMLTFLENDKNKPLGINQNIDSLIEKIKSRQMLLSLDIAETESLADEMFLADRKRDKNEPEKYNEYIAELEFVKERKKQIKSKGIVKQYEKNEQFLTGKIEDLARHNSEINQNREMFIGLYAERAVQLDESRSLESISAVLSSRKEEPERKSETIEVDTQAKQRELESLMKVLENNKSKFNSIYRSQKSKSSAHAKKWQIKIAELEEKVSALAQELNIENE